MNYIGDFTEDHATLGFKFFTKEITGNSASIPITLAGTPVLSVYKDNSITQITAGITLTVDFDGVVGLNNVVIDLSSDPLYSIASEYQVVITAGTVGGNSTVGRIVASFSIQHRSDERILTAVSNIATGAAAPSIASESAVITTGTEVNTYASTQNLDGGHHEVSDIGGVIDMYYQFDVGSNNLATSIAMNGRLEGKDDSMLVQAYNWGTVSWDHIGALTGITAGGPDGVAVFTLIEAYTGTGANIDKVRIRGLGTGLTSATLFLDRAVMRFAAIAGPTAIEIRTEIDSNSTQLSAILDDTSELQTDDIPATLATIMGYIDTEITTIIDNLAIVDGKVDTVDTVVDSIVTAVNTVDTVVDGIQTDLSNTTDGLGALKALIDTLDTVSDAIKAKTDQLTFTKALQLDSNAQSINGSTIVGDGKTTPWEGE